MNKRKKISLSHIKVKEFVVFHIDISIEFYVSINFVYKKQQTV